MRNGLEDLWASFLKSGPGLLKDFHKPHNEAETGHQRVPWDESASKEGTEIHKVGAQLLSSDTI